MGFTYGNRPGARIPAMEQRHFWVVADTIRNRLHHDREAGEDDRVYTLVELAKDFNRVFTIANPRFNSRKFYEACGITEHELNVTWPALEINPDAWAKKG